MPPRLLASGTWLTADHEITGVLGEGGMAVVYRAFDHARGREVAIKMLHANLLGHASLRRRFRREAELMGRWSHPNVVAIYQLVDDDDALAAVLELVDGPTLDDHLRAHGPVRGGALTALFAPILDAVGCAHRHGVVHRDLKPKNVLVADGAVPKVSDFGIAKATDGPSLTETGTLLGSCRFMAPEQAQCAADVDHRADIYSLGVMMYYALTGTCPFEGAGPIQILMAHVNAPPPPPSTRAPSIGAAVDQLILACLAKDPAARPQSCEELAARLAPAAAEAVP